MGTSADLPKNYDANAQEKKWAQSWEASQIFAYDSKRSREDTFVVDTPPPTVSGSLHMGHVFSYTQTDALVRYQRLTGKNIFYPMGWDDNGLPTERRVQNLYGVKCDPNVPYDPNFKADLVSDGAKNQKPISRKNFIELCGKQTKIDEEKYENLWRNLGISVDWNQQYETINPHCQMTSQLSFLDMYKKGKVYSIEAPTMWDTTFQTAVAQAEVEDKDQQGHFYDLKFQVEGGGEFLISTTRPELLPACIAVVAHPTDDRYKNLFGKFAITPLFKARVPILPADHADPEKGTGILMICTFGDVHDVQWWKGSNLPLKQIIGRDGRLLEIVFGKGAFNSNAPELANQKYVQIQGLFAKQAKRKIHELLVESGDMQGEPRPTQQVVKFYEKGDQPLEYVPTRQWFVSILKHKDNFLEMGKKVNWHPPHMKNKYDQWVEGVNQDWCISRQRYFGVPFPLWYPLDNKGVPIYDKPILASAKDLPIDPMTQVPLGYKEEQRGMPGGFIGDTNVMDTWATSSVTPQISSHWATSQNRHERLFPADVRPQAHEIIRTWAFYTIVKSYFHHNSIPWKNAAISGWVVDPEKKKMSKSKGNVVTPEQLIEEHSADAVRYWATRAKLGVDTLYDESIFKIGRRLITKLFNASKFVMLQLEGVGPLSIKQSEICESIDLAFVNELNAHIKNATKNFNQFDYAQVLMDTESLFWDFCDYYVEVVKSRAYKLKDSPEGRSAQASLDFSLKTFLQLFSPFLPFITEEVWSWRYTSLSSSVHISRWPNSEVMEGHKISTQDHRFELAKSFLSQVRGEKTKAQKSLKWPVQSCEIRCSAADFKLIESMMYDLEGAGNLEAGALKYIGNLAEDFAGRISLTVNLSENPPA